MFRPDQASTEVKIDFSPTSKARVVSGTVGGTLFCIAAALLVDSFRFEEMTEAEFHYSLAVNTLLPTALAAPLLWLLLHWLLLLLSLLWQQLHPDPLVLWLWQQLLWQAPQTTPTIARYYCFEK